MKPAIVAKFTALTKRGETVIVEVPANATFPQFYYYYTQQGRRRSTKRLTRVANRNEGIHPHYRAPWTTPGLELVAARFAAAGCTAIKVRILRKRAYQKLIQAAPNNLPRTECWVDEHKLVRTSLRIPVMLPAPRYSLKRTSILAERS